MYHKLGYLGWKAIVLVMLASLMLAGCDLSAAPKPTPIPQEPLSSQGESPSEADLYATAIASLGGQLTQTAIVAESEQPMHEETIEPMPDEHPSEEHPVEPHGTPQPGEHPALEMPTAGYMPSMPMYGVTPTPGGYQGAGGYESNYNPNLDPNYNANSPYGNPSYGNSPYTNPYYYPTTSPYYNPYYYPTTSPYYNPYYNPTYPYPQGGGSITYVVQPGDWLYNIARKFGVTPDAIIAANPGLTPNNIYPGQVLVIPSPAYPAGQQGQLQWYPRYVSTSVWYPEYYWSYGYNPNWYPEWYNTYGTPVASYSWLPSDYAKYGPDQWGTIPQYAICSTGRSQSPINIDLNKLTPGGPRNIRFHYRSGDVRLVSNDYTFQIDVPSGSFMEMDGVAYELMNITFHMPSEHTINGKPYYMEIQLVHYNANTGKWAIASVFVNEGAQDNSYLAPVWFNMPEPPYNWKEVKGFDPTFFVPPDPKMYAYTGSITTPPCTEGINWVVFAAPLQLSRSQIERYRSMFPYNARPVQDLNDRTVYAVQ